jgi:uncharacterized protein YqhQ
MDFKKIFIKDACPTKVGGQSVLEGIMMKGEDRTAVVVRLDDGRMHIKTSKTPPSGVASKIPIVRGVVNFASMLMVGMRTLIYSAEVQETYAQEKEAEAKKSRESAGGADGANAVEGVAVAAGATDAAGDDGYAVSDADGDDTADGGDAAADADGDGGDAAADAADGEEKAEGGVAFGTVIVLSVVLAVVFVVGVFIVIPTIVVNWADNFTQNAILLNLFEGVFRIALFVAYIAVVSRMKDIRTTFEYHGAEHKTIHCFEGRLELTPENCDQYETLHPRCGTSFLMFVMIIALLLFSLLGWPTLLFRILSRIILIPVIAGLSYELLRYAGRTDNLFVQVLSVPGLLLQKLTTCPPSHRQLEVAIAALKAVLVPADTPEYEGFCDKDGVLLPEADPAPETETDAVAEAYGSLAVQSGE